MSSMLTGGLTFSELMSGELINGGLITGEPMSGGPMSGGLISSGLLSDGPVSGGLIPVATYIAASGRRILFIVSVQSSAAYDLSTDMQPPPAGPPHSPPVPRR